MSLDPTSRLFDLLTNHGWIKQELAEGLSRLTGFRNILVHEYAEVDPVIVKDVLENHLGDLDAYLEAVRAQITNRSGATMVGDPVKGFPTL